MVCCKGKRGEALAKYNEKLELAKARLKNLPHKSKEIIAAVFADGKSYRINGCQGMENAMESLRIIGKTEDGMYQVVLGNSKNVSVISKEMLSSKLDYKHDVHTNTGLCDKAESKYDEER